MENTTDIAPLVPQELDLLPNDFSAVVEVINASLSPATRRAYETVVAQYAAFVRNTDRQAYPFLEDGTIDTDGYIAGVLIYLNTLMSEGKTLSTLNKHLAALKWDASRTNPRFEALLHSAPVKAFTQGAARNLRSHSPRKAQALTVEQLTALYAYLSKKHTLRSIRDKALLSIGIAGALRSSNIALLTLADVSPALRLTGGYLLHIRHSKTDQTGEGAFIPVASSANYRLDPTRHLRLWLTLMEGLHSYTPASHPDLPLFPTIRGTHGLTSDPIAVASLTITHLLRKHMTDAGITTVEEAEAFSSHSLRATFITLSSQAGVPEASIAAVSGHRDMGTLRSYDRSTVERHAQTDYLGG